MNYQPEQKVARDTPAWLSIVMVIVTIAIGGFIGIMLSQAKAEGPSKACTVAIDKYDDLLEDYNTMIGLNSDMLGLMTSGLDHAVNRDSDALNRLAQDLETPTGQAIALADVIMFKQVELEAQVANCKGE